MKCLSVLKDLKGSDAYRELQERVGRERIYEAREEERLERETARETARQERIDNSLRNDYNNSISNGKLSPLVTFEDYRGARDLFDERLVGLTTADGVEVRGYSKHFIERYFGSVEERRSGVELDRIVEALTADDNPVVSEKKNSLVYKTAGAKVSLNPKTGNLIQTNPRPSRRTS